MNTTISLALRNLTRQKRRSFMLALAIGFGFFIVTLLEGLASGAMKNLIYQISQINGGNVIVQGIKHQRDEDGNIIKKYSFVIDEPDYVENLFEKSGIEYISYSKRILSDGTILFNNKKVMTNVYGCYFDKEKYLMDSLIVDSGNLEDVGKPYTIVLSKKIADNLNAKIGDKILYTTETIYGQKNIAELTVVVITEDNSIMNSIIAYADYSSICETMGMKDGEYNDFSVFVDNDLQNIVAQKIEDLIRADGKKVSSRMEAIKQDPNNIVGKIRKQVINDLTPETVYVVASMNDSVPMLQQIIIIVHAVTTIILIIILLIVMVGISNTYRMILYERLKEIGTMRAVGMSGKTTGRLLTTEAIILSLIGAISGFILAFITMNIICLIPVNNESLSFFMENGHFTYVLSASSIILKYVLMIVLTIFAVRNTSKNASSLSPAEALR